jgi:hypothetical protein
LQLAASFPSFISFLDVFNWIRSYVAKLNSVHVYPDVCVMPMYSRSLTYTVSMYALSPHEVRVRAVLGCWLPFASSDVFLMMHVDPRYEQILVETFTLAQAAACLLPCSCCFSQFLFTLISPCNSYLLNSSRHEMYARQPGPSRIPPSSPSPSPTHVRFGGTFHSPQNAIAACRSAVLAPGHTNTRPQYMHMK